MIAVNPIRRTPHHLAHPLRRQVDRLTAEIDGNRGGAERQHNLGNGHIVDEHAVDGLLPDVEIAPLPWCGHPRRVTSPTRARHLQSDGLVVAFRRRGRPLEGLIRRRRHHEVREDMPVDSFCLDLILTWVRAAVERYHGTAARRVRVEEACAKNNRADAVHKYGRLDERVLSSIFRGLVGLT